MIETLHLTKQFDDIEAVRDVSVEIKEGQVFGLIGTNGAGKSTFLRMISGVIKADKGLILIDGESVYENVEAKKKIFYLPDEHYFFNNSTPLEMMKFYRDFYPQFDSKRCLELFEKFGLQKNSKVSNFSKGMKKQLSMILGICANTKYLLCDETFDGLDPVMRQTIKSLFAGEMASRAFTPVVASHNLRELEDICDTVGILHRGGVLLQKDLEEMKLQIHTLQYVLKRPEDDEKLKNSLDIVKSESRGTLNLITVRGNQEEIMDTVYQYEPLFAEIIPLSLEEIFISETEVVGYDIKKLIF